MVGLLAGLAALAAPGWATPAYGSAEKAESAERTESSRTTGYEIRWQAISAGGGDSTGGDFKLRGTIGQHSASADHPAASNIYSHRGGFWVALATRGKAVVDRLFRDRFE